MHIAKCGKIPMAGMKVEISLPPRITRAHKRLAANGWKKNYDKTGLAMVDPVASTTARP
jgi:hypothetical protein